MHIGVDLMGGENPPSVLFEAVCRIASSADPSYTFFVIAKDFTVEETPNIKLIVADDMIAMEDHPLESARRKKKSSMAIGIRLLKEKKIDAFVSAGNTGALVALAHLHLDLLPKVTAPALMVLLPKENGKVAVLDVGANISFKPHHLIEYAKIGTLYRELVDGIKDPKVALLNIGVEEKKGTGAMKEGYRILHDFYQGSSLFLGNVEGRDVFENEIDVLVTDGFTGNVFLKTCEGVSSFLFDYFRRHLAKREEMGPILRAFQQQFNYSEHPGALLCGLDRIVVKCHGNSDVQAFANGIKGACELVKKDVIGKMKENLSLYTQGD